MSDERPILVRYGPPKAPTRPVSSADIPTVRMSAIARQRRAAKTDVEGARVAWRPLIRQALWLWLWVAASEKAGDACEKTSACLLWCRIGLSELFLECGDSTLRIRDGLLHHENTLGQQVGSGRNLSELVPNQLIGLGILGLTTRLAQSIEQTGYEITFFGCHR